MGWKEKSLHFYVQKLIMAIEKFVDKTHKSLSFSLFCVRLFFPFMALRCVKRNCIWTRKWYNNFHSKGSDVKRLNKSIR